MLKWLTNIIAFCALFIQALAVRRPHDLVKIRFGFKTFFGNFSNTHSSQKGTAMKQPKAELSTETFHMQHV